MAYRTVNLRPDTYERLQAFKVAGMSFDEAVAALMDRVDQDAFYAEVLEEHQRRIKEMQGGDHVSREALKQALRSEER